MSARSSTFRLDGLCCNDEERIVERKLRAMRGVENFSCNVLAGTVTVTHTCPHDDLLAAFREIGLPAARPPEPDRALAPGLRARIIVEGGAAILLAGGIIAGALTGLDMTVVFALAAVLGGWRIAKKAVTGFFGFDMNVLMTAAALGAFAIGKPAEGAAVMVLFAVSQLLERYSLDRAHNAIGSLMQLSPPMAAVLRGGKEEEIPAAALGAGDRIIVRPGERFPADGAVAAGVSAVDESPITGEPIPVRKGPGDALFAGTLNGAGTIEMMASRPPGDSTLARIVRLVEQAQADRAPIERTAEKFARYYSPSILAFGVLLAAGGPFVLGGPFVTWFYRALVMLVIACPCALVISTPVTILSGIAHAARKGILLKGGRSLEEIGRIDTFAFDKTGTLTAGVPRVTDIVPFSSIDRDEILRIVAVIEAGSEHHLAGGVVREAREAGLDLDVVRSHGFQALAGRGVAALIGDTTFVVGNHELIEERGICTAEVERVVGGLEAEGKTCLILGTNSEALGVIALADLPRAQSVESVTALHRLGIGRIVMLTGDNAGAAEALRARLGIDEVHARVTPEEKISHVRRMVDSSARIAFVGDGINDAPALAAAHVGIAMGGAGTDVALETADAVLMSDDLGKLPYLVALGRKTRRVILQNIAVALGTKLVFLGLGAAGIASLWLAVLADDGATLVVIANGLRLLKSLRES